ncbi:MAG: hypothetical protein HYW50_04240, partial [Candidatus Diapherotrites archaeon]|nr:hypothetical protein [Candidatus Diapherotrites archaeon]
MRVFVSVLVAVAFIIFSINANAFLGEIPALIQFREVPKELSFSVTNSENVARELKVGVFFPVEHQFAQKPGIVGANS